jgi:hypothetical protein
MPMSFNGFGTKVCEARAIIDWGDGQVMEDADAVEAVCALHVPLIPYLAVHSTAWRWVNPGFEYRRIPIQWSRGLWAEAFARVVWKFIVLAGAIFLLITALGPGTQDVVRFQNGMNVTDKELTWLGSDHNRLLMAGGGGLLVGGGVMLLMGVNRAGRRHRDIRLVLGRHQLGSSDPASWMDGVLLQVREADELFGTRTYADAADELLAAGRYEPAMFAARLAAAREDRPAGERLTDAILTDPRVRRILEELRQKPARRPELLPGQGDWNSAALFDQNGAEPVLLED